MKLSESTVEVMKNFSGINQTMLFQKGSRLTTMSPQKSVIAYADITDEIPKEFAVYDLNNFLAVLGLFDNPDYNFNKEHVEIKNGKSIQKYRYTDKQLVQEAPETIKMPESEVSFTLSQDDFSKAIRAANVNSLPEIAFVGIDGEVSLAAVDMSNSSANKYAIDLGISCEKDFAVIFKLENMKMIERDYEVSLTSRIAYFDGGDVEYYVAAEESSKIG